MKIHITLVGGQPAPVYNGIKATKPDKVVFVHSTDSLKALNALVKEIDVPYEAIQLSPTEAMEIHKVAEKMVEQYAEDEVTVNISSGPKSWSHLFGSMFQSKENATVVYMDQNNVLWNYRTMQGLQDFEFDMHTHFRLYGNSIENNYKKFSDYTEADVEAMKKIEEIRNFDVQIFNALLSVLDKQKQHTLRNGKYGKFEHDSGSYVEWEKTTEEQYGFVRVFLIKKNGKSKEIKFESSNAVDLVFNSGWFEFKVAKMLSAWEKCKEVCLNCKFPFRENVDKNETDIIVNMGSKILFVECKTQINNTTDIDKFRSVIKNYGGMGSKGLFVTDAKMTEVAKAKCEEHGILSFSLKDEHLGLSDEKALQVLLESELYNLNTK
ncbi:MAG: DUF1887 family protein [Paludibacteraceae bacterium]|nr:DUF1887 family protein [Paludibacteraceae bacterium]